MIKYLFIQNANTTFKLLLGIKVSAKLLNSVVYLITVTCQVVKVIIFHVRAEYYKSTMVNVHECIPHKTTEENAGVTIFAACKLKDGRNPQNTQGIFCNIAKVITFLSFSF